MSEPSKERPDAWVPIPDGDQVPEEVDKTIRPIAEKIGFASNIARLLAITPASRNATQECPSENTPREVLRER